MANNENRNKLCAFYIIKIKNIFRCFFFCCNSQNKKYKTKNKTLTIAICWLNFLKSNQEQPSVDCY